VFSCCSIPAASAVFMVFTVSKSSAVSSPVNLALIAAEFKRRICSNARLG
jgi:hypothetical protein